MIKQILFDDLRKLVVGIWLKDTPDVKLESWDDDDETDPDSVGEYTFKDFLRYGGVDASERVKFIQKEGGGEGGGEHVESVIKVDDTFYKIVYTYRSYDGYDFDYAEVYLVEPVERVVTFYETI